MAVSMPSTSITLLKALASGTQNARWAEFVCKYEDIMRSYVMRHFPSVEADDVLQDAFVSLTRALPEYHYTPDEHGHFRNYLLGVVRHKALDAVRRIKSEVKKRSLYATERQGGPPNQPDEDEEWCNSLMHVALEQLMADDSIASRNREIFRHVALMGEPPERVASDFGVTRGNVDVIKARLLSRLKGLVAAMKDNG